MPRLRTAAGHPATGGRGTTFTGRSRTSRETRARILEAVVDLILEHGEAAVTMQEVAARAGISLRSLYYHFPERGALLVAAGNEMPAHLFAALPMSSPRDDLPAREALHRFLSDRFAQMELQAERLDAIFSVRGNDRVDALIRGLRERRLRDVEGLVLRAQRERSLQAPVADAVARAFLLTSVETWRVLRFQLGSTPQEALRTALGLLDTALFAAA